MSKSNSLILFGTVMIIACSSAASAANRAKKAVSKSSASKREIEKLISDVIRHETRTSSGFAYVSVAVGNTEHIASLKDGRIIRQTRLSQRLGGIYKTWAVVGTYGLDERMDPVGEGGESLLKRKRSRWHHVASNGEGLGYLRTQIVRAKVPKDVIRHFRLDIDATR